MNQAAKIALLTGGALLLSGALFGRQDTDSPTGGGTSTGGGGGGGSLPEIGPFDYKGKTYTNSNGDYTGPTAPYRGGPLTDNQLFAAFNAVKSIYPTQFLNEIERAYRLETAHFTSGQFQNGYSAGMVANTSVFPYGWNSLANYANARGLGPNDFGVSAPFTVDGQQYYYIMFPTLAQALDFMAWFIQNIRGGNIIKWNTLDTDSQQAHTYRNAMDNITLRYSI